MNNFILYKIKNDYDKYNLNRKMDHREIGKDLKLFFFHQLSPGSCFFLPHGTIIYNTLVNFIKEQYLKRGFKEVLTPNIFNTELFETSGHWDNYKENMFIFSIKDDCECKNQFALKPMNCPSHALIFSNEIKSYKELPLRLADFGVLHRNELSNTLTGLTRVRKFCQDDAHIFCTPDQIKDEIKNCLSFLKDVYDIFGFKFNISLSTRPENYIGTIELWNVAEEQLKDSLNNEGFNWNIKEGDGAFYGPKIDIEIKDNHDKLHQCATIQLDFNLPDRFKLKYINNQGNEEQPVMIHRAIFGSVERFFAILLEHYNGKLPFWLSPRQIIILSISKDNNEYATQIYNHYKNFNVELDLSDDKLNKKIRNAQMMQFNFICVVGPKEQQNNTISVRNREGEVLGNYNYHLLIDKLLMLKLNYSQINKF